jgi:dTDP-4-dehydrorhamnose 3,5-epimerase
VKAIATTLPGVVVIEPEIFRDDRGALYESYNRAAFARATGVDTEFVQDNHSVSRAGVLRGLHYQLTQPQGKLVRVVRGAVFDVAVDIRPASATFGGWVGTELTQDNRRQMWIPPGFAHGCLALSDAEVVYKLTSYYAPEDERSIAWNDPRIGIAWPLSGYPVLSLRDRAARSLATADLLDKRRAELR